MPTLSTWTYTLEDLNRTANQVKDVLAVKLNLPVLDNFLIVVQKPSVFGRFKKWLCASPEDLKEDLVVFCVVSKNLVVEKEEDKNA